jgi:AI-2 transport protein TqsA
MVMDLVSTAMTVLIFMLFLLMGESKLSSVSGGIWHVVAKNIRSYIVTKTFLSVATGVAFGGVLWMFQVPFAFLFGMLAFLLHYIPHIGPIVAGLLPVPLILLYPEMGVLSKVLVILIGWAVQIVSGNVIEPLVMGESFEMHPVAVMLALMFWGMIWGVAGMFLSVPITAAISMLLERFEVTRGVSLFISGRLKEIENPTPKISLT